MSIYGLAPHLGATSVALLPEATAQLTSPTPASPRRQGASSEGPAPTHRPRPALAACINQQARCLRVPLPAPVAAAARSQTPSPLFAFSAASAAICSKRHPRVSQAFLALEKLASTKGTFDELIFLKAQSGVASL